MTYNVFGETLNLTQLQSPATRPYRPPTSANACFCGAELSSSESQCANCATCRCSCQKVVDRGRVCWSRSWCCFRRWCITQISAAASDGRSSEDTGCGAAWLTQNSARARYYHIQQRRVSHRFLQRQSQQVAQLSQRNRAAAWVSFG